jgi:hypothetical protein
MAMRRIFWGFQEIGSLEDIRNRKKTRRVGESLTLRLAESAFDCLKENSASWRVAMVSRGVAIRIF